MERTNFLRRRIYDKEAGVDEDLALPFVTGLERVRAEMDRRSWSFVERAESLSRPGISLIEVGAGLTAVAGAVGIAAVFLAERT